MQLPIPYQLNLSLRSDQLKAQAGIKENVALLRQSYEELTNGSFHEQTDAIIAENADSETNYETLRRQRDMYYTVKLQETLSLLTIVEAAEKQIDFSIKIGNN